MGHPRSRSRSRTNLEEFNNSYAALREYNLRSWQPCSRRSTDKMTEDDFARPHGTINTNTRSTAVKDSTSRAQQRFLRTDSTVSRNPSLCEPYCALPEGNPLRILAAACCEPYVSRGNEHTGVDVDLEITPVTVDESTYAPQDVDRLVHTADTLSSMSGTEFEDTESEDTEFDGTEFDGTEFADSFVDEHINKHCAQADATANERVKRFMLERFHEFQEKHIQEVIANLLPVLSQIHVRRWSEDPTESRELSTLERVIKETFITERCIAQLKRLLEQEKQYRTELIVQFSLAN